MGGRGHSATMIAYPVIKEKAMWQNVIIIFIIAVCLFFVGRRIQRQLSGSKTGCGGGCGCSGCDTSSVKTKGCETK
ncbi:MAG: hypothetical protein A2520_08890 [Deltaproteobacteria bacterium RIFOXYD12_FULL_53_23]|nr:MAG: hypothetical protein A2520_08890 [Deltaproteobacteria bacterium RIFOXYD12_FULL_53_23]